MHQLILHQQLVTLSSSPPSASATNMCVGGLLGSHLDIHVHSGTTSALVRTPLTMPTLMDCQSHTDLKLDTTILGHRPEATRKAIQATATVLVRLTQEPAHRHLWGRTSTFTVNPPLRYPPPRPPTPQSWYTNNTLWDGEDCYPGSSCCDNPLAPWFRRTLQEKTTEDIEVRWCNGYGHNVQKLGIELLDITFTTCSL